MFLACQLLYKLHDKQAFEAYVDIVRDKKKTFLSNSYQKVAVFIITLLVFGFFFYKDATGAGSFLVDKESVLIDTVQQGEFLVSVRGSGVLVPKDVRWVATDVEGRVERILIKAGAQVKAGDLLLELSNPRLVQQLEETKWELEELEAQTRAQQVSLESSLLDQEAAVLNEKLNYERTLLTFNAQKSLLDQGVAAVSHIAHSEIKIDVAQFKERWQLQEKRLDKQRENFSAQQAAYSARINRMKKTLQRMQQQVDGLKVTATMDSVVQAMPMELGQQVSAGTNLARLARNGEFLAELRVPEKQVKDVAFGQTVEIDTRSSKIQGVVKRIDPAVINGSVQVDIELTSAAPKEARPDLTVDGVIEISRIKNALFVKRPMFSQSGSSADVYVLANDGSSAIKQEVSFGQMSTKYIEIKTGISAGQSIIVSDGTKWQQHQQIRLN